MATRSYTGAAPLTAQVCTVTPGGTIAATDTFTVWIGQTSFTFTATTTTVAHVVTGLYTLIAAAQALDGSPEWEDVTVADSTTTLTITANTAGKPFSVSSSVSNVSGGAAPTLTSATTTANSGPEQYDLASNWSGSTLPTNGDTVVISGNYKLRYGDLSSVTAAILRVIDFTGEIGLKPVDPDGNYNQYRGQYFLMSATVMDIFQNTSNLMRFNVGTAQTLLTVYATGTADTTTGIPALTWLGTHASNEVNVINGSVGFATEAGEAATIATLRVLNGTVESGQGVTLTALTLSGGELSLYNNVATVVQNKGDLILVDDPDITTSLTMYGGTCTVNGSPTITALVMSGESTLDCTQDARPFTITSTTISTPGPTIDDPQGRVTWTNDWTMTPDHDQVTLRLGKSKTVNFN